MPIWPGLNLYFCSWDFGAALPSFPAYNVVVQVAQVHIGVWSGAEAEEAEWRQMGSEAARGDWRRGREVVP